MRGDAAEAASWCLLRRTIIMTEVDTHEQSRIESFVYSRPSERCIQLKEWGMHHIEPVSRILPSTPLLTRSIHICRSFLA